MKYGSPRYDCAALDRRRRRAQGIHQSISKLRHLAGNAVFDSNRLDRGRLRDHKGLAFVKHRAGHRRIRRFFPSVCHGIIDHRVFRTVPQHHRSGCGNAAGRDTGIRRHHISRICKCQMYFAAQREPCPGRYRRNGKISAAAFRHDDALGSVVQHGRRTFRDLETAVFQLFQLRRSTIRRIIDGRAPGQGRQQDLLAGHYLRRRRR